jgi:hypothetical protein
MPARRYAAAVRIPCAPANVVRTFCMPKDPFDMSLAVAGDKYFRLDRYGETLTGIGRIFDR